MTGLTLMLEDPAKGKLFTWILEYIREYGISRKGTTFSVMAGSRSETGVGEFVFKLDNPQLLNQTVEIKAAQKNKDKEKMKRPKSTSMEPDQGHRHSDRHDHKQNKKNDNTGRSLSTSLSNNRTSADEIVDRTSVKKDPKYLKELNQKIGNPDLHPNRSSSNKKEQRGSKKDEKADNSKEKEKKDKDEGKSKKKGFFSGFGKKEKAQSTEEHDPKPISVPDEHLYDEAGPLTSGIGQGDLYSEVRDTNPSTARKQYGKDEDHMDKYNDIKRAASENKGKKMIETDYDDTLYDHLESVGASQGISKADDQNLYGMTSGRPMAPPKEQDDMVLYEEVGNEYDDAASVQVFKNKDTVSHTPLDAYEEVDL